MREDIMKSKKLLESKGYKISKINESAVDEFWSLYDSSREVAAQLEDIADELGISNEEEPTESEAKRILSAYKGEGNSTISAEELIESIMDFCERAPGVSDVSTFEDAGLLTRNKGFVVTTEEGRKFHFSLLGSY